MKLSRGPLKIISLTRNTRIEDTKGPIKKKSIVVTQHTHNLGSIDRLAIKIFVQFNLIVKVFQIVRFAKIYLTLKITNIFIPAFLMCLSQVRSL